jgi:hypothetical protein
MQGEWPILLRVMGKTSVDGLYLSLDEIIKMRQRLTRSEREKFGSDGPGK